MTAEKQAVSLPVTMNDYDRLYLLMAKWKLVSHLFNPLCYVGNIKSIADLEMHLKTNWNNFPKDWLQSWQASLTYSDDIETIKKMVADSKSVNLEELPAVLGIKKNNYKDILEAAGVLVIPKDQLSLQRRIALGRPYSGDVYLATWTRNNDTKVEVVVRCDVDSTQRELFIREAKMMCGIQHDNIMNFYGAVILGTYADSVGLVVELFSKGNLEEFGVSSIFQAWLFAWQLSSALEYLERRQIIHTSIMAPFIYVSSHEKIKIGGFMFCYLKEETEKAKQSVLPRFIGHQGQEIDSLSTKGVVALFGHIVTSMFRYLVSHCSSEPLRLLPDDRKWSHFCPYGVAALLKRCSSSDAEARPSFEEIVNVLAKEKPTKLCFKVKCSSAEVRELSYDKGEVVWVISQDPTRYQGMWFGQKQNGKAGFFNRHDTTVACDGHQVPHEIRARGIEAELAYKSALLEGEVRVCRARLLIIGQDRAGKTSLKKSLLGLPFDPNEPSTEGLEVNPSKFEVSVERVVQWKAVAGKESDCKQLQQLQERNIAKLVAERLERINADNTTVQPQGRMEEDKEKSANTHVPVAISSQEAPDSTEYNVPTSEDLPDGPPLHQHGPRLHPTQGPQIQMPSSLVPLVTECLRISSLPSAEDSCAKETVLDIWDFAGQHLYYSTHPVFFSRRAIYLLVYNLSKNLHDLAEPSYQQGAHTIRLSNTSGETNLATLQSWMASVHSIRQLTLDNHASEWEFPYRPPPVLVVGTHADKLPSPVHVQQVEAEISSAIADKAYQEHVLRPFYSVNNTLSSRSPRVKEIQKKVQEVLETGPHMIENLPVKWLNFEKAVKKLAEGETFFVSLDHARNVAREECFVNDDKQLDAMLNFYHDLGVIVRFKETVVINTQWLIDLFRKLITVRPFKDQDPVDGRLWEDLEKTGILHPRLINRIFADSVGSTFHQQSILDLMEMYGFLAKFGCQEQRQGGGNDGVKYFVPAQLTVSPGDLWSLKPGELDPCPLLFKFLDGFVPHGLFPQLVSRLISRCHELECFECPKLFYNGVQLGLGRQNQFDLVILCSKHYIKLILRSYCSSLPNDAKESQTLSAVQVRALVEDELNSLCQQWQWLGNARYEVCVPCLPCEESAAQAKDAHQSAACSGDDSFHMIPVCIDNPQKLLTCSRIFGDRSRFTLPGLDQWYVNMPLKEQRFTSGPKFALVSSINLIDLAGDIGTKWKLIGRILNLEDPLLDQIEADEKNLYEKCYSMLLSWQQRQEHGATCERLAKALCHKHAMKNDLVMQYCYEN